MATPTQWDALRYFRWVQSGDLIGGIGSLIGLPVVCWGLRTLETWPALAFLLLYVTFTQLWLATLIFRCSYFILLLMARCKTLPDKTVRYALSYIQKKQVQEDVEPRPKLTFLQFRALRQAGWIKPIDFAIFTLVLLAWCTSIFLYWRALAGWAVFPIGLATLLTTTWCVLLAFRCSWFALQLTADVQNIPLEATRLLLLHQQTP